MARVSVHIDLDKAELIEQHSSGGCTFLAIHDHDTTVHLSFSDLKGALDLKDVLDAALYRRKVVA